MTFQNAGRSNKGVECRRIADQIARAARFMGLEATTDASNLSASRYVYIEGPDASLKIRCSDHADRHGGSDWQAWAGECPSLTIARLAEWCGRPVPNAYTAAAYNVRASAASRAGEMATKARAAVERDQTEAVVRALRAAGGGKAVMAGRIVDQLYPGLPRAARQRLANAAAYLAQRAESALSA